MAEAPLNPFNSSRQSSTDLQRIYDYRESIRDISEALIEQDWREISSWLY